MPEDPFAFSDSIREIDEESPFISLKYLALMRERIALLCVDMQTRQESLYTGYVKSSSYHSLEIETFDNHSVTIRLTNADFYAFRRSDAPSPLKAITTEAYRFGLRFVTPELYGYLLAEENARKGRA